MQPRPVESGTVVDGQTRAESTASDRDQAQHQMRQACVAMDRALRSGTMARAERWLEACPAIAADEDLAVELIYSEYVAREELGPPPDPSEFLERFPQWAPHLQRLFALDGLLGSESGAGRTTQHEETTRPQAEGGVRRARRVPGFELMECLGTGGMGVVWRAWQERPRRVVALKLMRIGADAGAVERARFRREAEVVARLNPPHIVGLYEIGEVDGEPFLVFEYVSGGNLKTRLGGQPMPWRAGTELGVKLARAIAFAHGQGGGDRDLKPANVLLAGPTDGG
ncbi:MAG TPA: serine/threonine-protein kinase, partial [Gemmatales bacterium]|nr:serine/threonine-protein kinase [Gemmatales bacterium]